MQTPASAAIGIAALPRSRPAAALARARPRASLRAVTGPVWLAVFLLLAFTRSTATAPAAAITVALAALGWLHFALSERAALLALLRRHRALFAALAMLMAGVAVSQALAAPALPEGFWAALPAQVGLTLCLVPLVLALSDARSLRAAAALFIALCAWHVVAMPVEAVTGAKLSWHVVELLPRSAGLLHYQASGLAQQAYYFPGLLLPLFYMAWGLVRELSAPPSRSPRGALGLALCAAPLLWLVPVLCVQSRSALAGAVAASALCLFCGCLRLGARTRLACVALMLVAGALAWWLLFSTGKSGPGLRWAYAGHYFLAALHWPGVLVGHGLRLADPDMVIAGLQPIAHSHNDLVQMLYSWGLLATLPYAAFWLLLLGLIGRAFVRHGRWWPACTVLALAPSLVTDLGFQHYEKAVCMVLLTALCMVLARPGQALPAARQANSV